MDEREASLTPHSEEKIKAVYRTVRLFDRPLAELFIDDLQETINLLEKDDSIGAPDLQEDPSGQTLTIRSGRDYRVVYLRGEEGPIIIDVDILGR